jgi:hypothetical protein
MLAHLTGTEIPIVLAACVAGVVAGAAAVLCVFGGRRSAGGHRP